VAAVDVTPDARDALAEAYAEAEAARRADWHARRTSNAAHHPAPPALYPTAQEFIQLVTQARPRA